MDRREAIRKATLAMGGTLSAPVMAGLLKGCTPQQSTPDWVPQFLTAEQGALVAAIAEIIIPATDTPGAKDVGVPEYIDQMLMDVFPAEDKEHFRQGLIDFTNQVQAKHNKAFVDCNEEVQNQLLMGLAEKAKDVPPQPGTKRPFFSMMKELTIVGFFTSEAGATQVLEYIEIPGRYDGCVPLEGKAWAIS
ncbi:MAG: gluconate 2-dehydrogenase subunit 3 family protein [Cyclobacteriaceae bacterium]|nr:gluconate 2-dehydrogenase subunit 3 family protein [Cyclobacteriaceae bacterium]